MRFPVIRVKDVLDPESTHIVGTDPHDSLFIDEESGGIHYRSLQNSEGTQKILGGEPYDWYAYEFEGKKNGYDATPYVEFVSFEELLEHVMKAVEESAENKAKLLRLADQYYKAEAKAEETVREAQEETGVIRL